MASKSTNSLKQARPGLRRMLIATVKTGKLFALLLVLVSGAVGYLALTSPRFTVQTVRPEGNRALTAEEVQTAAAVTGESIWFVHTPDIQARIAESPYVETVDVRLQLPDAVIVSIRERQPDIRWIHDGQVYAVTSDGLIVDQLGPNSPASPVSEPTSPLTPTVPLTLTSGLTQTPALQMLAPLTMTELLSQTAALTTTTTPARSFASVVTIIDTTPNRPLKIRDHVDADAVQLATRVFLRRDELGGALTRIEWDAGLGISLIMGEGHQAVLGSSKDLDRKLAILRFIVKDGTPYSFVDLRPTTPYYR